MAEQPLESPTDGREPVTGALPHDAGRAPRFALSGRRWRQLGSVGLLGALAAGLMLGARSRGGVPKTAILGTPAATLWRQTLGVPSKEFDVPGLGRLPSLRAMQRWDLGEGRTMIDDVSGSLGVFLSSDRSFRLVRFHDDQPPAEVGAAPANDKNYAQLEAGGRRLITLASNGWMGDGSFVAARSEIFDIEDPDHPIKVGEIALETDQQTVQPWGDYILVGESRMGPTPLTGSLRVIQLLGPEPGKEVGRLDGETRDVAVDGDRAYLIRSCGGRAQPTEPPEFFPEEPVQPPPIMMETDPNFPDCLGVVDLSDASRPGLIAEVEMPVNSYPSAIAAHGGYVYMAQPHEGILIADARGSGAPVFVDARTAKDMKDPMVIDSGGFLGLAVNGSVLYFGNHTTIAAFDLSAPEAPKPLAAIELGQADLIDTMTLDNGRLYVSTGDMWGGGPFGLWVIDAPADPAELPR
ncbi:MAG: hypothetical protein ABI780_12335 [Ardenticatenales bacterium]